MGKSERYDALGELVIFFILFSIRQKSSLFINYTIKFIEIKLTIELIYIYIYIL